MSPAIVVLLLLAGCSEAAGRILPLVVRRPGLSRTAVAGWLLAGGLVEGAVFALWPLTAWTLAGAAPSSSGAFLWTPGLLAPLTLTAVLAFPMLGPLLHLLLFAGVGAGLAGPLAAAIGLGWWPATGCLAVAGTGLAVTVAAVRRLVMRIPATEVAV
ncbi:hypothetical protein DMA12_14820 [Amycolatopsis balhimycina DSM 5908]|uniref:Integral membrane protein n=1 Tax=Amycolatopsis balhimycina DSM 5908 TaxID=1081091 RepID=A0A428WPF1_AMYBA|nr:hypothetical protein [Amycolatopsis balhimycina]RSM44930.1 hypothetical protein DMA12_14820 [Amycolatopsis balhimycina DSM 5908]